MNIEKEHNRRRILLISPVIPKFGGIGIEVRAWSHLEALSTAADIDLVLTMTPDQVALASLEEVRPVCNSVTLIRLKPSRKMVRKRITGLTALTRAVYVCGSSFQPDRADMASLCERMQGGRVDIVFCFRIGSYDVFEHFPKSSSWQHSRLFVDFDDIESLSIQRELPFLKKTLGFESALIARIAGIEASLLELRIQRKADIISVCSEVDRTRLVSRRGHATVVVIPNSFPRVEALPLRPVGPVAKLLFLGTMSYSPNEDAILYFCQEIYPRIRARYRRAIGLTIVGRRPSANVLALAEDPSITVTGGVDFVEPYYDEADLVVAPIRFGGGTRIKILEALSFRRPVVATTLGAEGLDLKRGRDLEVADDPENFADICVTLLENQNTRFNLATSGRERVGAVYERNLIQGTLVKHIRGL